MKRTWLMAVALPVPVVQVPSKTKPEFPPPAPCAAAQMFLVPVKPDANVRARFTVSAFPEPDADDPPTSTVHALFCSVPEVPIAFGVPQDVPASFIRYS